MRTVIFDLDGTLSDSLGTILRTLQASLREHGHAEADMQAIRGYFGVPLDDMCEGLAPGAGLQVSATYRSLYERFALETERTFEGTVDLLDALRHAGRPIGIATGKSQNGAVAATTRLGLHRRVDAIHGIVPGTPGKPHPAVLLRAIESLGASIDDAVMVGDTVTDMRMARDGGVRAIGVTWGSDSADELAAAGPIAVVDTFDELRAALGLS